MYFKYKTDKNHISGENFRITVLTERLIRLEYNAAGSFIDEQTQMVTCRDFPKQFFNVKSSDGQLSVETGSLILSYNGEPFSSTGLSIKLKENGNEWHYSIVYANSDGNLLGTARTLDMTDGFVSLEGGIFGERGFAVIDDSESAILKDGEFVLRKEKGTDIYFFGYGNDYYGGLKEFYTLTGNVPMIPRFALGNWWSRYYRYTEESYLALMNRFEKEKIPLSVAVIDMDWHITDVDPKYGTGWTGYSWDKKLFPDHKRFLKDLKRRGLHTTLNLHPADGIRAFEDMYEAVADRLGIDPESEKPAEFDFSDKAYRDAYFEEVLHPYEKDGVDFWWIDWQQGKGRAGEETDPLFLLNHYHYKDMENRGVRPMIFSRYAGAGSHRYPIGFSGDTHTTWKSLDFQPYFTSTSSNIGYGWWSHDIGGHMLGEKDNERLVRWVQFGVFSPIMRIHSSSSPFFNKEPWTLEEPYRNIVTDYMRLRHKLVPYLYTMTYIAHSCGRPLIRPVYYMAPDRAEAREVRNEYGFGDEIIVGAITSPVDDNLKLAEVNMYLPDGRWYDYFNGRIYGGGEKRKLYRKLEEIPVLFREGAVIPLSGDEPGNGCDNPKILEIAIGYGRSGKTKLYEDDGISMEYKNGKSVGTVLEFVCSKDGYKASEGAVNGKDGKSDRFRIYSAEGSIGLIPEKRSFCIKIYGARPGKDTKVYLDENGKLSGLEYKYDRSKKTVSVNIPEGSVCFDREVIFEGLTAAVNDKEELLFELLDRAWIPMILKEKVYGAFKGASSDESFLKWLSQSDAPEKLKDAIREFV
ncbi:MAG: DUF5110 domain-containing protein [Lachnospiraceae bacterium]|nr:DUF5110 domain-containing protein [Lachnospiraceae bacterium]